MRRKISRIDPGLATRYNNSSRDRGWKKISEYEHELSQSIVAIYLATDGDVRFRAFIGDERLDAPSPGELQKLIDKYLGSIVKVEWQRIIELQFDEGFDRKHYFRDSREKVGGRIEAEIEDYMVTVERVGDYYLQAKRRENPKLNTPEQWMKDAKRFSWRGGYSDDKDGEFKPPVTVKPSYEHKVTVYLPYTPETWAALVLLVDSIEALRVKLLTYLSADDVVEKLATVGVPLLPPPEKKSRRRANEERADDTDG